SQNTKSDYSTHGKTDSGRVHLYAKTYDAVQMKKAAGYEPEALPPYNTESYALITENDFRKVSDEPLSTFSIDVDNASYSNTRRFIMEERFPPKDAVRIEELINYFEYDYEKPSGKHPFSVHMEVSDCPWNSENRLVHIGLKGKEIPKDEVPPSNIVFLLDVSGSMDMPNKLPLLKSAFRMLVRELTEKDRVAIVVYAGASGQVLPATPGNEKRNIIAALDKLEAGGSTAGAAGIELAYKVAAENFIKEGNNRVIIATDGDFNVGVSSDAELVRLIEEKRDKGIFLSVLGFGTGNYKDSKMEQLADKGNGNYAYIDNIQEARKVLVTEMLSTLYAIAKDVKLQVEFNPAQVSAYRLIGYENRMLHNEDFDDDKKDAGEMGIGHTVTALYEIVPAVEGKDTNTATRKLKYQEQNIKASAFHDPDILTLKLRYKLPEESKSILFEKTVSDGGLRLNNSSDNFRFAAAVAGWGMLLRDSKYKGDNNYAAVLRLAKTALGEDKNGYRKEFVKMVELCEAISDEGISAEK
ncbi:MAG TPA: VWA domain-containing protein, partial [Phaeodactylibacter sp.]|nr:VWA domain-containing protein [Phaeodactylibacter sp.]